jgi:presenilin-like A22 family membrane protease
LFNIDPKIKILAFFLITQFLAILTGAKLFFELPKNEQISYFSVAIFEPNDIANSIFMFFSIIVGAVLLILISKFFKGNLIFNVLEFTVIASASFFVFFALLLYLNLSFEFSMLFGLFLGAFFAILKYYFKSLKNTAAVLSSAGVGAIFGFSVGFIPLLIFILLLSLYDYLAVFKTKHMIYMAKQLSSRNLSFSLSAAKIPVKKPKEKEKEYVERIKKEGEALELGTGDITVPAMLSVSAYALNQNGPIYSLAISLGSSVAIFLLMFIVSKRKIFLPALPPVCLGGLIGMLFVRLLGY